MMKIIHFSKRVELQVECHLDDKFGSLSWKFIPFPITCHLLIIKTRTHLMTAWKILSGVLVNIITIMERRENEVP